MTLLPTVIINGTTIINNTRNKTTESEDHSQSLQSNLDILKR